MLIAALAWFSNADASCEERDAAIALAEQKLLEFSLGEAEEALLQAEDAIPCGPAMDRQLLARFWLAEAVLLHNQGDKDDALLSFAAASRVDNLYWNSAYGPEMRRIFEQAVRAEDGTGIIEILPPPDNYIVSIDGVPAASPLQVTAGLHLVQAGQSFANQTFAKIILVRPGKNANVETGIVPVAVNAAPAAAPPPSEPTGDAGGPRLHVAFGPSLTIGRKLGDRDQWGLAEPGGKFTLPFEMGFGVDLDSVWARGVIALTPLVGGKWLWADADGVAQSSALAWGGHVAGGVELGGVEAGLLLGGLFPGRITAAGVGSVGLGELPLRLEGRLGLNFGTGGRVEGNVGGLLVFAPTF